MGVCVCVSVRGVRFAVWRRKCNHDVICLSHSRSEALIEKHIRLRRHDLLGGAWSLCLGIIAMVPRMVLSSYKGDVMPTPINAFVDDDAAKLVGSSCIERQEHFKVHRRRDFFSASAGTNKFPAFQMQC